MNRHTVNPAFPHPDQPDQDCPTLDEAIKTALEILRKEGADMYSRRSAAFDLMDAYEFHKEQNA